MTNLDHIQSLIHHGAQLRGEGGTLMPLTEAFYHKAVEGCHTGGYNAATYDLVLPAGHDFLYGGAGVEFFPLGNDKLRLHAVYFRDNHDHRNNFDVGITWRFNIYKRK